MKLRNKKTGEIGEACINKKMQPKHIKDLTSIGHIKKIRKSLHERIDI